MSQQHKQQLRQQQQQQHAVEESENLRYAVIEADDLHRRVHNSFSSSSSSVSSSSGAVGSSSLSCAKRRQESARIAGKVLDQLDEFEKNASLAGTRRFSFTKFFTDAKLTVPQEELIKPSDTSNPEPLIRLQKAIERLVQIHQKQLSNKENKKNKKNNNSSKKAGDEDEGENDDQHAVQFDINNVANEFYATNRFLTERAPELVDKCLDAHKKAAGLKGETWASIPDSLLVLLDDVITSTPVDEVMEESEESRKRFEFNVEEFTHQQHQAIEDGDMKAAEELYFKKVVVQESMVPLYDEMNSMLDTHHQQVVMEPATRAQEVHSRANSDVSAIASRNDTRKTKLQSDLKTLLSLQRHVSEEDRNLRQRFVRLRSESDNYLKENLGEMDKCYSAMEELEKQVARLASERTDALSQRLSADVQEAQRICDLENFYSFAKQHKLLLETSLNSVDASDEVTDLMHEFISSGSNAVGQRIRAVEGDIESERTRLHELRLAQFRQLYLTLGDLQYKKERNLEELDKKIEQVHIQQEIAMDTFNPKAKDLANAKKELLQIRDEMNAQIGVISDKASLQIEYFKPTEEALISAGKNFVHPVEELQQKNEMRQQKLLQYHQLMQESAEDPVSSQLGGGNVEAELEQIEALKEKVTNPYHKTSPNKLNSSRGGGGKMNSYSSSSSSSVSASATSSSAEKTLNMSSPSPAAANID